METTNILTGSCLCGAVAFMFETPSIGAGHCHCTMCQRAHGAGFVTWIAVREDGFKITKGDDVIVHFRSSDHLTRSFCGRCGSSMLCNEDSHDNVIDITLANIHGEIDKPPTGHFFYDCRAPWTQVNDDLRKFGGETGMEKL